MWGVNGGGGSSRASPSSVKNRDNGDVPIVPRGLIDQAASSPTNLRTTTQKIIATILQAIKAEELGLQTYFNFRSKSEQDMLREPFWERQ
jgi:hypothetical protein